MAESAESVARSELEVCVPVPLPKFTRPIEPERRRHPRHGLPWYCWVEAPQLTLFGPIHDIAAGGLFVRTAAQLTPGTPVELKLRVAAGSETLEARAVVARSGLPNRGLGLEFVAIERGHMLLRSLLDRATPRT